MTKRDIFSALILALPALFFLTVSIIEIFKLVREKIEDQQTRMHYTLIRIPLVLLFIICIVLSYAIGLENDTSHIVPSHIIALALHAIGLACTVYLEAGVAAFFCVYVNLPLVNILFLLFNNSQEGSTVGLMIVILMLMIGFIYWQKKTNPLAKKYFGLKSVWDLASPDQEAEKVEGIEVTKKSIEPK